MRYGRGAVNDRLLGIAPNAVNAAVASAQAAWTRHAVAAGRREWTTAAL